MKSFDFERFEAFEEQVHRARELFLAATRHPKRLEMMRILETAERTLDVARKTIGLDDERCDPQPWWIDWQEKQRS